MRVGGGEAASRAPRGTSGLAKQALTFLRAKPEERRLRRPTDGQFLSQSRRFTAEFAALLSVYLILCAVVRAYILPLREAKNVKNFSPLLFTINKKRI